MKYVCTSRGVRTYRLFGDHETHADVAEEMGGAVLSAGFVHVDNAGSPYAYGESVSLGVKADPETDTHWLRIIWGNI